MNHSRDGRSIRTGVTLAFSFAYVTFFIALPIVFTYVVRSAWRLMLSCEPVGLFDLGLLLTASLVVSGGVPALLSKLRPEAVAVVPFDLQVFLLVAVALGTLILGFYVTLFVLAGIGLAAGRGDEFYEAGVTVAKAVPLLLPSVGFTVAASTTPSGLSPRARVTLISTHLGLLALGLSCVWIIWEAVCA